ncbi:MAG TPA: exopolysaccharide biosynthesis protein [Candidatus Paceibacterota bacterium]|nr:exopolysaccharide biosynthesis protein [Candidatus Paceibacterota bacterium]
MNPDSAGGAGADPPSPEGGGVSRAAKPPPLSKEIELLLQGSAGEGRRTLNGMLEGTGGRGVYLLIIVLSLPFVTPLPLPAVSTVLGAAIILLAIRQMLGLPPRLPRFLGERPVAWSRHPKLVQASMKLLRFIKRWARPRGPSWLSWRAARIGNGALLVLMALFLTLPLPLPFTNTGPCYAIILLSASLMEEDGKLVWVAYACAVGTLLYFGLISGLIAGVLARYYSTIYDWVCRLCA